MVGLIEPLMLFAVVMFSHSVSYWYLYCKLSRMMEALTAPITKIMSENESSILVRMEKDSREKTWGRPGQNLKRVWKNGADAFIAPRGICSSIILIRLDGQTKLSGRNPNDLLENQIKIAGIAIANFKSDLFGIQIRGAQQFFSPFDPLARQVFDKRFAGFPAKEHTKMTAAEGHLGRHLVEGDVRIRKMPVNIRLRLPD